MRDARLSRRGFVTAAGAGLLGAAGVVTLEALAVERGHVGLTRHEVRVPGLDPAFDGWRLAHVTDLHLPACDEAARLAAALVRRERPELVALTGDVLERGDLDVAFGQLDELLPALRGTVATWAIPGNHEHVAGVPWDAYRARLARHGTRLLANQADVLAVRGSVLRVFGSEDRLAGDLDAEAAVRARPDLLLLHRPTQVDAMPPSSAGLALAGHTHGGQLCLPGGVALVRPSGSGRYTQGWYDAPAAPLFVSRGVGTSGVRMRASCPAEVALLTLRAA
ncbi:MAG: metallophosphoesterase [Gemmatimonadales bacterium]|nr:metallophosphoesterase [Gemmatimonadales bacterium]